ncbi:MAG: GNAT family N-acetyltransferase [Acidimicrobiia bacterium]
MARLSSHTVPITLADGTQVELRPIVPEDKPLLTEGLARLSPRSRYLRFMSSTETLTRAQLAYLSELDYQDHFAWGVLHEGAGIAVGRYIRLTDDRRSAEVALTVLDEFQGKGVGRLLVEALAVVANEHGIDRFEFIVLAENRPMLALLEKLGAATQTDGPIVRGWVEVPGLLGGGAHRRALLELADSTRRGGHDMP